MASLILPAIIEAVSAAGFVGPVALGQTFASAGALLATQIAGGLLDSLVIFPRMFSQPATEGQRIGDLNIAEHTEGVPQNRYYGREVPVAGTLVWATRLREVKDTTHASGKGGRGGEYVTWKYFVNVGLQFGRGEIAEMAKIWADGKVFFNARPDFDEGSDQIAAEVETVGDIDYLVLVSDLDDGGPDLSLLMSGKTIVIDGFTGTPSNATDIITSGIQTASWMKIWAESPSGAGTIFAGDTIILDGRSSPYEVTQTVSFISPSVAVEVYLNRQVGYPDVGSDIPVVVRREAANNNGKFQVSSSSFDDTTDISKVRIRHRDSFDYAFTAKAKGTDTVTLFQVQPTHKESQVGRISFQTGERLQEPDALLVEFEAGKVGGAAQVYGCGGRSMMWLEDLEVTDFGNRIPNFEGLPSVSPQDPSRATAIASICEAKGLTADEYDVSGVTGECGGYAERGPQAGKKTLQPLLLAYQIRTRDVNGKVFFEDRAGMTFLDLDVDDGELGVYEVGGDAPQPMTLVDAPERQMPRRIDVNYIDPENDYKTGSRHAKLSREQLGSSQVLTLPIVMSKDEAQRIADQSLALSQATRRGFRGTILPSRTPQVLEGTGIRVKNAFGRDWTILVTSVERGANMLPVFEGLYEDPDALIQEGFADGTLAESIVGGGGLGANQAPPDVVWNILDIPALRDQDADQPGRYFACVNPDRSIDSRGFIVYESTDGGQSYEQIAQLERPSTMGDLVTAPSSSGIDYRIPDTQTVFRISILTDGGEPSSVTLQETARGRNRFLIGDEIVGAANVVFVSEDSQTGMRTYDVYTLLRGLADTDDFMTHAVGDRVVMLSQPGVQFVPCNVGAIDDERTYKVVSHGGNPDESVPALVTITGRNVKPYRVVQIQGTRDGSNNLTIRWQRRTRAVVQFLDQGAPFGEDVERYRVDILSGAGAVLRTFHPDTNSQMYTAADQTTDGFTPGDPVDVRVRQMSNRLHWGRPREEEV